MPGTVLMANILAILLTIVVAIVATLLWRLVAAIERREAQFDRRDDHFVQALREMHDLTAAVRKLVDVILTRWGAPPGAPAE
jgi:hypothetical protein